MDNSRYCIIMAGGIGSRFWPVSTPKKPKQFLDILGTGESLLQMTFRRMQKVVPMKNIFIVTGEEYRDMTLEHLQIGASQVIAEPARRNTAPCIAYAAYLIRRENPNAQMIVTPADHLITKEDVMLESIEEGFRFIGEQQVMLTFGIVPTRPDTGYGYIQIDTSAMAEGYNNKLSKVKTFVEKPQLKFARQFVESGEFMWNGGIFMWGVQTIIGQLEKHLPDIAQAFEEISDKLGTQNETEAIRKLYSECRNVSIDYGVMEHSTTVHVLQTDPGWSDLGTWGALLEKRQTAQGENVLDKEQVTTYESSGNIVHLPNGKRAVICGLNDFIVADTEEILLICPLSQEQQIRQFVRDIEE